VKPKPEAIQKIVSGFFFNHYLAIACIHHFENIMAEKLQNLRNWAEGRAVKVD
jgi:hypothetical protein